MRLMAAKSNAVARKNNGLPVFMANRAISTFVDLPLFLVLCDSARAGDEPESAGKQRNESCEGGGAESLAAIRIEDKGLEFFHGSVPCWDGFYRI